MLAGHQIKRLFGTISFSEFRVNEWPSFSLAASSSIASSDFYRQEKENPIRDRLRLLLSPFIFSLFAFLRFLKPSHRFSSLLLALPASRIPIPPLIFSFSSHLHPDFTVLHLPTLKCRYKSAPHPFRFHQFFLISLSYHFGLSNSRNPN